MQPFTITKIKLYGKMLPEMGFISQMRGLRLSIKMKSKDMAKRCAPHIGSPSHLSGLEHNRQVETTEQVLAYAKALGVKELTIIM